MTLNITVLSERAVWICADHRLVRRAHGLPDEVCTDESIKFAHVTCHDGEYVITYTGIGAIPLTGEAGGWEAVSMWLARQLQRRHRDRVGQSLDHICGEASREKNFRLAAHVFAFAGFLDQEAGERRAFGGLISNYPEGAFDPAHLPRSHFHPHVGVART